MKTIKNLTADQLRKSILQLAIEGKLVKQDPNDEPASELVKKIMAEKKKLIQEGKIKKDKNESYIYKGDDNCYYEKIGKNEPVKLEDLPFDIPDSWTWIRQKDVCWLENGCKTSGEKLPYLEAKVIRGNKQPSLLDEGTIIEKGTNVILVDGENSGEIMSAPCRGYMGSTFKIFSATSFVNYEYILALFLFNRELYRNSKTGAAIPHLNKNLFRNSLIALPPLAEQQRIVDRINSFEPLLTKYDSLEKKLSVLEAEFPEKLKKSILQYAIEGKLVKQDPNDEPASVLLERIKAEKERLIKEGKIKRDKNESYIYQGDDKNYYEKVGYSSHLIDDVFALPVLWKYIKLSDVITVAKGGSPRPIQDYLTNDDDGINWIKIGDTNLNSKYINSCKEKIKKSGLNKTRYVQKGDFLLTNSMSFGHPYILAIDGCIHDGWLVLSDLFNAYDKDYLYYLLSSPYVYKSFCSTVGGSVVKNLNSDKVSNAIVPLLPLNEQRKIAKKLDFIFNNLINCL